MENEVINVAEEAIENDVLTNDGLNKKTVGKVTVITLCTGVAIAGFVMLRKYKGKIKEMRIKKKIKDLEKEGYSVMDCEDGLIKELDEVEINGTDL